MRQTQHPLANGNVGQDVIDEVRRPLRHATAATAGTEAAALARKRDEAIEAAPRAPETGKTAGQKSASEKGAEFVFDERRQAFAVAKRSRLRTERFEVIADDLIQRALTGAAGLVLERRSWHERRLFTAYASAELERSYAASPS